MHLLPIPGFDLPIATSYVGVVKALQFETELHGKTELPIPPQIAARLPDSGKARVILLIEEDAEDAEWRQAAYERFVREDSPEDSVYDKYAETR